MFEHRTAQLVTRSEFFCRLLKSLGLSSIIILISLLFGMLGYHFIEGIGWIDSYENAAMILSGMGPVAQMQTDLGKIFAGTYALYSGLVLVASIGVLVAPIAHRLLHKFHVEIE